MLHNRDATITLNLLQPSGTRIQLFVQPNDTILRVKRLVENVIEVPEDHMLVMMAEETRLEDSQTVLQCGLNTGDFLTVVVAQRTRTKISELRISELQRVNALNLAL